MSFCSIPSQPMKNPNKAHRKFAGIQWFAFATVLLSHRFSVAETVAPWKEWSAQPPMGSTPTDPGPPVVRTPFRRFRN